VIQAMVEVAEQVRRGLVGAVRARWKIFLLVAAGVFVLDLVVPPVLLSVIRKPADYFTFNPWLKKLPEYLVSGEAPFERRLERTWGLVLFWFSASNSFGIEWGFAVTVSDLARFVLMALVIGAYFAVWFHRRDRLVPTGWGRASAQGGMFGAFSSVFGLATGGCTVMGCGAPVMPVVGLAFAGLSSTTLKWMAELSTVATVTVFVGMGAGLLYMAWRAGAVSPPTISRGAPPGSHG
jgi:hypothetical protein